MLKTGLNESGKTPKTIRGEVWMDPAEKLAWVERQIRQARLGRMASLACPYCLSHVLLGAERLCCMPLGAAAETVLRRMETEDLCETGVFTDYAPGPLLMADAVEAVMGFGASLGDAGSHQLIN